MCLAQAQTDNEITFYQNKCNAIDRQIDQLVYSLYDLRKNEIDLIESEAVQ